MNKEYKVFLNDMDWNHIRNIGINTSKGGFKCNVVFVNTIFYEEITAIRDEKYWYLVNENTIQKLDKYKNIVDELKEDIPCLLEIINRNEKDIKVYQDEWIAVRSIENKLKELKGE